MTDQFGSTIDNFHIKYFDLDVEEFVDLEENSFDGIDIGKIVKVNVADKNLKSDEIKDKDSSKTLVSPIPTRFDIDDC